MRSSCSGPFPGGADSHLLEYDATALLTSPNVQPSCCAHAATDAATVTARSNSRRLLPCQAASPVRAFSAISSCRVDAGSKTRVSGLPCRAVAFQSICFSGSDG